MEKLMEKLTVFKINGTFKTDNVQEFSVDHNGFNYLVIYGHHINGWFIAIPNWQICTEAGPPDSVPYNTEKLSKSFGLLNAPLAPCVIAEAVKKHWETNRI